MRSFSWLLVCSGCGPLSVSLTTSTNPPTSTATSTSSSSTSSSSTSATVDAMQHEPGVVDILFVIDDSCSMAQEQPWFSSWGGQLFTSLAAMEFDFHLGSVRTDVNRAAGHLVPDSTSHLWIDAGTPDKSTRFQERTQLGTAGFGEEQGFEAASIALVDLEKSYNLGFRRPDAQLAIVVLADEPDYSPDPVKDYVAELEAMGSYEGDVTFSAILPQSKDFPDYTPRYLEAHDDIGGLLHNLQEPPYDDFLADLPTLWWTSVPYELSATPDTTTLEVWVDADGAWLSLDEIDWVYDSDQNTVRFTSSALVSEGTDIEIRYDAL